MERMNTALQRFLVATGTKRVGFSLAKVVLQIFGVLLRTVVIWRPA